MVDRIYDLYNVLNDKNGTNSSPEALDAYHKLIEAIQKSPQEKKLSLQFISKFCKNFPTELNKTLEAVIDLCEDEDITVRFLYFHFPILSSIEGYFTFVLLRFENKRSKNSQHWFVHRSTFCNVSSMS